MSMTRTSDGGVGELLAALSAFQANVTGARKGGANPHFRSNFTRLEDAHDAARERLGEHGLSVVQMVGGRDESGRYVSVDTIVGHSSGQWIARECRVAVDERQAGAQADGSAISYARRYAYLGALGLASVDDDGNAASGENRKDGFPVSSGGEPDSHTDTPSSNTRSGGGHRRLGPDDPMPFGKHKGTPIRSLPGGYVEWLRDNGNNPEIREDMAAELARRDGMGGDEPPPPTDEDLPF